MDHTSIIVAAVEAGAVPGLKAIASEAVKDAYDAFIALIKDQYAAHKSVADSVDALASNPGDQASRVALEAKLKEVGRAVDPPLMEAAGKVLETVERDCPEAARAIGMDIGIFRAAALDIKNLRAPESGTAFRAREMNIEGTATLDFGGPPPPKQ